MRMHVLMTGLALAVTLTAGCRTERYDRPDGADERAPAGLAVADIELGRTVNADKTIADRTDTFRPTETIYASVRTTGAGSGTLKARWLYQDGQLVEESTETIAPTSEARTEFHVAKPDGWPEGKYRLELTLNGIAVGTREFQVRK